FDFVVFVVRISNFFFFQAEDGIRDRNVTGVQTCALPISLGPRLRRAHAHHGGGGRGLHRQTGQARSAAGRGGPPGHCPLTERSRIMNFRKTLLAVPLASLLATVGAPARSAAVVLAPTTVDVYTLEFEPTQNALAGSDGVMTIKPLPGGTLVAFKLRGGYPNTVYTIWTVYNRLVVPLPTDGSKVPSAGSPADFPPEGNGVAPLARLDKIGRASC